MISEQKINTMNLIWGFNMSHAKDPKTDGVIPVDLNDMDDVCALSILFSFRDLTDLMVDS